jgi:hypothetical protein
MMKVISPSRNRLVLFRFAGVQKRMFSRLPQSGAASNDFWKKKLSAAKDHHGLVFSK